VTGRGEASEVTVGNGHTLTFVASSQTGAGIISIQDYDFVLQHAANRETDIAVTEWLRLGWGKRIVLFGGGTVTEGKERVRVESIALLDGMITRSHILALSWRGVPETFRGDAFELVSILRGEGIELLPALAILCQGHLAVHAAHGIGRGSREVETALKSIGWHDGEYGRLLEDATKLDAVRNVSWWLSTFGLEHGESFDLQWANLYAKVRGEWLGNAGFDRLKPLLDRLRLRESPSLETVAEAYIAIAERLGAYGEQG
jgi:hypothetical protein